MAGKALGGPGSADFVARRALGEQVQHLVSLEVQISWQAQHLVNLEVQIANLEVQISWQAQRMVNLEVQISWQAQRLVNLKVQISRPCHFFVLSDAHTLTRFRLNPSSHKAGKSPGSTKALAVFALVG